MVGIHSPTQKQIYSGILILLIGLFVGFHSPHVFAATNPFPTTAQSSITTIVMWVITGLNAITWIFFIFLSYLLDPHFIFNIDQNGNSAFLTMLNSVWQLSRDLMNILFAIALVAAAIYTIVTANVEFVKQHLPKFVMAVVLVNFSWFFPQVILDVANVATATIYGIPSLIPAQSNMQRCSVLVESEPGVSPRPNCTAETSTTYQCPCLRVRDTAWFVDSQFTQNKMQAGANNPPPTTYPFWLCYGNVVCMQYDELDMTKVAGQSAILNGLIVNQARLGDLVELPPSIKANNVQQMIGFIIRQIVILAIHIALFFPLAALVLAFTIRLPILWLTMAFMPFIFLMFVADQEFITKYPRDLWKYFLKAAFLPAMVAVPFTIGFIMLNVGSQLAPTDLPGSDIQIPLLSQVGTFGELIWLMMSIGILWVGVFSILQDAGPMSFGASFIKQTGEALGRIALTAPLALPIIPGPGGSGITPMRALHLPREIDAKLRNGATLEDVINGLKNPKADDEALMHAGEKLGREDPEKLREFDNSIQKLIEAMKKTPADDKERAAIEKEKQEHLRKINEKLGTHMDSGNLTNGLEKVMEGMRSSNASAADSLKKAIEEMRNAKPASKPAGS